MTSTTLPAARGPRLASIDAMRGLVMAIMLLDHVRESFYLRWQVGDPMDVDSIDPALFFSRLAAHFCAPMFVFLTGLSAWLYAHPPAGPRPATGFLLKRGLLLVLLELTVISAAWGNAFPPKVIYLQVIWAIGLAMMALAVLHRLPRPALVALGLLIVAGHNVLTPVAFAPRDTGYSLWSILHQRGWLVAEGPLRIKLSYPLLPWIGVIVLGYAAGPWYVAAAAWRRRRLLLAGALALALLVVLRGFNLYGETLPWRQGVDGLHTLMSFLNYTKYPPSLDFLLLTLGVGCLALAWMDGRDNGPLRCCATLGGAPMFYYILHLYVLLALRALLLAALGPNHEGRHEFESLWMVWALGALLLPLLYLPCAAFARFKRRTGMAWVRYF
ncbi:DUF1624 domain-containing protein [Oxalobacteraceae bacterium A2-2]